MLDWQHRVTYSFVKRQRTNNKTKVKNREKHIALSKTENKNKAKVKNMRSELNQEQSKLTLSDIVAGEIIQSVS